MTSESMRKMTILVVDDEEPILELVQYNLEKEGYKVLACPDGKEALKLAKEVLPHLIVLDIMLPGISGFEICRYLRRIEETKKIPIIILSARIDEFDRILGLELGADDYMTKPFSLRELVAKVKARLRNNNEITEKDLFNGQRIVKGDIEIYPEKYSVYVKGVKQPLTPKEFELLHILASNPGKVYSREYLLEKIWGYDYQGYNRTVDVHIRQIRRKIGLDGSRGKAYIESLRGVGYRFCE